MEHPLPKIIDCFIFYNELDLLNYRLNILNEVVDYFILVESIQTFVGKEKPLHYNENKKCLKSLKIKLFTSSSICHTLIQLI